MSDASTDVNSSNFSERLKEIHEMIALNEWDNFNALWPHITKYHDNQYVREPDPKYQSMKNEAFDALKVLIEKSETYEQFQQYLQSLAIAINDPKTLWETLHSKLNGTLKVTFHQAQIIAATFFQPHELFEYGFSVFHQSSICSFVNITNEEALIDIFYATAGFVRACHLSDNYEAQDPEYESFITQMLTLFTQLPDFDAHRFVWLIEAINQHLHLRPAVFRDICSRVIHDYISNTVDQNLKNRLYKLCVITTSPFLQSLTALRESIDSTFLVVIKEQRKFIRKYIFSGYSTINWLGNMLRSLSPPLRAWRLYLSNMNSKMQENPELPNLLLIDFMDDSLLLFNQIYGDIQPSKNRACDLRLDIFAIVDTVSHLYPVEMSTQVLKRLWYLLFIAAIVGASEFDFDNLKYEKPKVPDTPMLGLDRTTNDFVNYRNALQVYGKQFENEIHDMESMFKYLRANITIPNNNNN